MQSQSELTEEGKKNIRATLNNLNPNIRQQERIVTSKSVAGGIAKAGKDYDLVVIGAAKGIVVS